MDEQKFGMIAAPLPQHSRYRALLRRVLEKLPEGWDEYRTFGAELQDGTPQGLASALRFEALGEQRRKG